jgi:hypothetical protein
MENPALDFTGTIFSVRTKNALKERSILTLGQLTVWHKNKSLSYIENLGAQSEDELISFLATHDQMALDNSLSAMQKENNFQDSELFLIFSSNSLLDFFDALSLRYISDLSKFSYDQALIFCSISGEFKSEFKNIRISMSNKGIYFSDLNHEFIFSDAFKLALMSLGSDFSRIQGIKNRVIHNETLEDVGKELDITRERVRQIESKFLITFQNLYTNKPIDLLEQSLQGGDINGIVSLESKIPIFNGLASLFLSSKDPMPFLKTIFSYGSNQFNMELLDGDVTFYGKDAYSSDEIVNEFFELIVNEKKNSNLSLSDFYKGFCLINNRDSSFDLLYPKVIEKFKKSKISLIKHAAYSLSAYRTHFSADDVLQFINKNFDINVDIRRVENGLADEVIGLYLTKSNNFIFYSDLGIDEFTGTKIIEEIVKVLEQSPNRQFYLPNVFETIRSSGFFSTLDQDLFDFLEPAHLSILLKEKSHQYPRLKNHLRLYWSLSDGKSRIEIYPLVVEYLKKQGCPMALKPIKEFVNSKRGLGKNFQLHATASSPEIICLDDGTYGLRSRDIKFDIATEKLLVEKIISFLENESKIILHADFMNLRNDLKIDTELSNRLLVNCLKAYIPVGGTRAASTPYLISNQSNSEKNFYIYHVSIDNKKIKKLKKDNYDPDSLSKSHHKFWATNEILNFFNKNNILTDSDYGRWRKGNHPEKIFIPSPMTLKKMKDWPGFPKSGKGNKFYPIEKIIKHLKAFNISSNKEYLEWRRSIPDGKQLYPANLNYRDNFPGWYFFKKESK